MAADVDDVLSRRDDPRPVDPRGERPAIELDRDRGLLTGGHVGAGEAGEVAQRAGRIAGRRLDVDLHDLTAVAPAGVAQRDLDGDAGLDATARPPPSSSSNVV